MLTLIISAYPGCGKTTYYEQNSCFADKHNILKIVDLDSTKYSCVWENGKRTNKPNPDFPYNYLKDIRKHRKVADIILISSDESVRKALKRSRVPFITVYPKDTLANMKEWRSRFTSRGNTQSYIAHQMENWSKSIQELSSSKLTNYKYELDIEQGPFFLNKDLVDKIRKDFYIGV